MVSFICALFSCGIKALQVQEQLTIFSSHLLLSPVKNPKGVGTFMLEILSS